jgi:hypothetical protein
MKQAERDRLLKHVMENINKYLPGSLEYTANLKILEILQKHSTDVCETEIDLTL